MMVTKVEKISKTGDADCPRGVFIWKKICKTIFLFIFFLFITLFYYGLVCYIGVSVINSGFLKKKEIPRSP